MDLPSELLMPSIGEIERFGYRKRKATLQPGLMDYYTPNQQGAEYFLKDTFGLRGTNAGESHKVTVNISYRGAVIKDGKELTTAQINSPRWRDHCVAGNEWNFSKMDFF